jgi:carboxylesterase
VRSRYRPTPSPLHEPGDDLALAGDRRLGCLLIHGFTATPDEVRPVAEMLATRGFPVRLARLAGHDSTLAELARCRWTDWLASAESALARLTADVERVVVGGMSMGALLAFRLAVSHPTTVAGVVSMAAPLDLGARVPAWLPWLERLPALTLRRAMIPKRNGRDISDPVARAQSRAYEKMPLPAVLQLLALQRAVLPDLPRVAQPTLVLHGRHDHTAPVESMAMLQARLGSRDVEAHVLEESWHVVTEDVERALVGRLVGDFLERVERDPR